MDFQAFVSKTLTDKAFAQSLAINPEGALRAAGVELDSIERLAHAFRENKAAAL